MTASPVYCKFFLLKCILGDGIISAFILPNHSIRAGYNGACLFRHMEFHDIAMCSCGIFFPAAGDGAIWAGVRNFGKLELFADYRSKTECLVARLCHGKAADAGVQPVTDSAVGIVVERYHIFRTIIGVVDSSLLDFFSDRGYNNIKSRFSKSRFDIWR